MRTTATCEVYDFIEYPSGYERLSIRSIKKMEQEADKLLEEGDYIQGAEKYYKIAEEIVKTLGEAYATRTMKKVKERIYENRSPWTTRLLYQAVDEIVKDRDWENTELEKTFRNGWRSALSLHRDCFHDYVLPQREVLACINEVKNMIRAIEPILEKLEAYYSSDDVTIQ